MNEYADILASARRIAATTETWADLSNALFDPYEGIIPTAFPSRDAKAAFLKSNEYKQIRDLMEDAMNRTGIVEGATPKKSGRFIVRLPQSLHAALEREAQAEGVSLNQLVVVKLAMQLSMLVHPS